MSEAGNYFPRFHNLGPATAADPLPLDAAAEIAGVPAAQLKLWAWDRVGPRNIGTRTKPMYDQRDLEEWKDAKRQSSPEAHDGGNRARLEA